MLSEKENYQSFVKLSFDTLRNSFIPSTGEPHPAIISKYASHLPLFGKNLSIPTFLRGMSERVYSKSFLRGFADINSASDANKLLWHVTRFDDAVRERKSEYADLEVMTQLDLYSKIVHEDDTLLAVLHAINWLEEVYEIPSPVMRTVIDFKATANMQARFPKDRQLSFDLDSVATATELDMDPKERQDLKRLMHSVYYLLRKGLLKDAEDLLESSSQSLKAATLIGGLPSHNFGLADGSTLAKTKGLDNYYIPNSLKTKELLKAFEERQNFYKESKEKTFTKTVGNNDWLMWTQNARLLSSTAAAQYYKDELGNFERSIFGSLCGNKEPLLEMSTSWHDRLWATFKSFFSSSVLKEFIAQRPIYSILFTGAFNPHVLSTLGPISLNFSELLSVPAPTPCIKIQQVLLTALLESATGVSDSWSTAVHALAGIVRDVSETASLENIIRGVVAHILIAMLYEGKIDEDSYEDYTYVLKGYIQSLSELSIDMQMFYSGFLLKKEHIVNALSNQFIEVMNDQKKLEIISYLSTYFPQEKDRVVDTMWRYAFAQEGRDDLLFNSVQWYLLDKGNKTKAVKELLKLCRHFLLNEKINEACSLYKDMVRQSEGIEESRKIKTVSLIGVYQGSQTEAGRREIVDLVEKMVLLEEIKGLKTLIEVIEARRYLAQPLAKTEEERARNLCSILKTHIRQLLFEGERPIVSISPELTTAAERILTRTPEKAIHESELQGIINQWVGRLIKWDIERALDSGDIESVWELLEQVAKRELTAYITNDEEIQEILAKVGDAVCLSPDVISSLLSY